MIEFLGLKTEKNEDSFNKGYGGGEGIQPPSLWYQNGIL